MPEPQLPNSRRDARCQRNDGAGHRCVLDEGHTACCVWERPEPQLHKSSYPWLRVEEGGVLSADMVDTTPAEMDRRLVIMQELRAGRVVLPEVTDEMVERIAAALCEYNGFDWEGTAEEPRHGNDERWCRRDYREQALAVAGAAFSTQEVPDV